MRRARSARLIIWVEMVSDMLIAVARSWEESATLEGTASQASWEESTLWGK